MNTMTAAFFIFNLVSKIIFQFEIFMINQIISSHALCITVNAFDTIEKVIIMYHTNNYCESFQSINDA